MTLQPVPPKSARRLALERSRESKRPSRGGQPAGSTGEPDRQLTGVGFPALTRAALASARLAPNHATGLQVLLTLNGSVPESVARRSLRDVEELALDLLVGEGSSDLGQIVFVSDLGLTVLGRPFLTLPASGDRPPASQIAGVARRIGWTRLQVERFRSCVDEFEHARRAEVTGCRAEFLGLERRVVDERIDQVRAGARRTPPFVLYRDNAVYSNFLGDGNLIGKSIVWTDPACVLAKLKTQAVDLWTDEDVVVATCLHILISAGGYGRIEECNSTQLSLRRVAQFFAAKRLEYRAVPGTPEVDPVPDEAGIDDLVRVAGQLRVARGYLLDRDLLYREIDGPLLHKKERVIGGIIARPEQEQGFCASLRQALPLRAESLDRVIDEIAAAPGWLFSPYGGFGLGVEALIHAAVRAAVGAFDADFALSRGLRSFPELVDAMRAENYAEIVSWELPKFYCCVVPGSGAIDRFDGVRAAVADAAWAMAARMEYNTWHGLPGNLPKSPVVEQRDYLSPGVMPDVSRFSDQHHRGHVTNKIRFTIRCPQAVTVLGHRFSGQVDLRLLRCAGAPFVARDLRGAREVARFIAAAVDQVAARVVAGERLEITSFDHEWHRETFLGPSPAATSTTSPQD